MSINYAGLQMSSSTSSLKILLQGKGSGIIPANDGTGVVTYTQIVIPHGYANDNLIWQVGVQDSALGSYQILPFGSHDNTRLYIAYLDSTNLYIEGIENEPFSSIPNINFNYYYRIFIP